MSEETAHLIDEEIRSVIDRNLERAERLLMENLEKLHVLADALMKYETIDRLQIDDIMEGKIPRPPTNWEDDTPTDAGQNGWNVREDRLDESAYIGKPAELH